MRYDILMRFTVPKRIVNASASLSMAGRGIVVVFADGDTITGDGKVLFFSSGDRTEKIESPFLSHWMFQAIKDRKYTQVAIAGAVSLFLKQSGVDVDERYIPHFLRIIS